MPGLGCAFAIVPDPELREHFTRNYDQLIPAVNLFGWVGAEAAYRYGEPWRLAMLAYLRRNRDLLEAFAEKHGLPLCKLEATYLGFLDCRALLPKLNGESPRDFFLREAKVALHDGTIFGSPGWVRINIATHTDLLRQALDRLSAALERLGGAVTPTKQKAAAWRCRRFLFWCACTQQARCLRRKASILSKGMTARLS